MKIAILGTSNSVLRDGYTKSLSQIHHVDNYAIGACCFSLAIHDIDKYKIAENYDYAIFDFCINDHQYLLSKWIGLEHLNQIHYNVTKHLASSKTVPIFIALPNKLFCDDASKNKGYLIHRKLCENNGIILVDGYRFIEEILNINAKFKNMLFIDNIHLKRTVAQYLGDIALEIIELIEKYFYQEIETSDTSFFTKEFSNYAPNLERICINTSIRNIDAVKVKRNDCIYLKENGYLSGLLIDANNSKARISLKSENNEIIKNLYTSVSAIGNKPQLKHIPLFEPIDCTNGIEIKITDRDVTEPSPHSISLDDSQCAIISSLNFISQSAAKNNLRPKGINRFIRFDEIYQRHAEKCVRTLNIIGETIEVLAVDCIKNKRTLKNQIEELAKDLGSAKAINLMSKVE